MKTSNQILPGVRAIGWVDCRNLPRRVDLHGVCNMAFAVLTDIHDIPFFDEPECRCKTLKVGLNSSDTATLKFFCAEPLPMNRPLGFVVTDQQGKSYLIGAQEPPYPAVNTEIVFGTPDGEPAGFHYEITHQALKSLVNCIV